VNIARAGLRIPLRAARRIKRRVQHRGLILLYHRVARLDRDPFEQAIAPDLFEEQMATLARGFSPMTLVDMAAASMEKRLPRRAVAVTFDDGYADNLHAALPPLERYQVPATIFVTSAAVGRRREFWWDEMERVLLSPGRLPGQLEIEVAGRMHAFDLGSAASYDRNVARAHSDWSMISNQEPTSRHRIYAELFNLLLRLPPDEVTAVLDTLVSWAEADPTGRDSHRSLTREEMIALGSSPVIEIGAHTVTHQVLASGSARTQRDEIEGSRDELHRLLGWVPTSFAYPYGFASSYDEQTISLVRGAGFERACTTAGGPLGNGCDPYALPRVWPRASNAADFRRRLDSFLSA
jgi:peptidoglycan/xylan/chitin deacetylase (PgdA/CDA1 family)